MSFFICSCILSVLHSRKVSVSVYVHDDILAHYHYCSIAIGLLLWYLQVTYERHYYRQKKKKAKTVSESSAKNSRTEVSSKRFVCVCCSFTCLLAEPPGNLKYILLTVELLLAASLKAWPQNLDANPRMMEKLSSS